MRRMEKNLVEKGPVRKGLKDSWNLLPSQDEIPNIRDEAAIWVRWDKWAERTGRHGRPLRLYNHHCPLAPIPAYNGITIGNGRLDMEIHPQSQQPHQPMTLGSLIATILVMVALFLLLSGLVFFFAWIVWPLIPERVVPNPEQHRGVGESLTFFELEPLTGNAGPLTMSDLNNRVVLINFWGPWCHYCRDEIPHLTALRDRFSGQKSFQLLVISYPAWGQGDDVQSLAENTVAVLKKLDVNVPTYRDPDNMTESAIDQLIGFEGFPTTLLLDRRGVIRAVWVGYRSGVETEIERFVDRVLSEDRSFRSERSHQ
jgi:cytochrome c biogenesis protein CcmG, thiol:disulfide interchange protein DsbE